jgi:hypothetical protein
MGLASLLTFPLANTRVAAGSKNPTANHRTAPAPATSVTDIALDDSGVLSGRFVDVDDQPIDGALVQLFDNGRPIARTTTNAKGSFEILNVSTGSYRLTCGSAAGRVRCWSPDAAPPSALTGGLTFQDNVIRGQAGMLIPSMATSTLVTTAATASAAVGGVSVAAAVNSSKHGVNFAATPAAPLPTTDTPQSTSDFTPPPGRESRWTRYNRLNPPPSQAVFAQDGSIALTTTDLPRGLSEREPLPASP